MEVGLKFVVVLVTLSLIFEAHSAVVRRRRGVEDMWTHKTDNSTLQNLASANKALNVEELNADLDAFIQRLGILDYEVLWEPRFMSHMGHDNALHYTNQWLVHIPKGNGTNVNSSGQETDPDAIAKETGYVNKGQVEGFPEVYKFIMMDHPEKHHRPTRELTDQLAGHSQITWADQQYAKLRTKRDFDLLGMLGLNNIQLPSFLKSDHNVEAKSVLGGHDRYNDPLWEKEWYLLDKRTKKSLAEPRLDLNVIPVFNLGFTGKGTSVCVLDDGLEHTHPDIRDNYDPRISGDLNDEDADPMPAYNKKPPNSHGTRCAGEIAMKPNNSVCGVGIAYDTRIGAVRMLDGPVCDLIEGRSLTYALAGVDIYSASWGPSDDGMTVEGPGRLAQAAFVRGTTEGRGGKGVVYVWASGNGGANGDSCSCDGYASSIYTLSVGSATEKGAFPWYGELCPSTLAVTYSSGAYSDKKVATTDLQSGCTTGHTGTSASAPMAAGIVALTLEANGRLTWRDVQHLVVWTAQPGPLADNPGWYSNAAGFRVSPHFGFGLLDAHAMVSNALKWVNVPKQKLCQVTLPRLTDATLTGTGVKRVVFTTNGCKGSANEVNFLEHIEVVTDVQYNLRGALTIDLTSPQGTTVRLLFPRKKDLSAVGFSDWPFMSVHTWGEAPAGSWILTFSDAERDPEHKGTINSVYLAMYGTKEAPDYRKAGRRVYPNYATNLTYRRTRNNNDIHENDNNYNNNYEDSQNPQLDNLQAILNDMHVDEFI